MMLMGSDKTMKIGGALMAMGVAAAVTAGVVNSKATSNPLIGGIVGIEAKSKNLKDNFECINIYFDDTTLYETTEAPTFETPEVPAE